ncbi:MAG: hypothetical protein J7K36_02345 [Archaeoglobaceae archaeon]|nr:hypothetical protein [Archaeoglobaceae archaeon]
MFYLIEAISGEKLNMKALSKRELQKMNETKAAILNILAENKDKLYSAKMLQKELKKRGIDTRVDNVRYHVNELLEMGFVKRVEASKRLKKSVHDPRARYFYRLNTEYIGFYYIYPEDYRQIEQRIPKGRYDLLVFLEYDVLNMEGDIAVSEFFVFTNNGDEPIKGQKHWFFTEEGFITFEELELEAFDNSGSKLQVELLDESDIPRKNVHVMIHFERAVKKNEIYLYWYRRRRKKAIALKGDRIYYDAKTPAKLVLISATLQKEVKAIKRVIATFKDRETGISAMASVQPFWYVHDGRVKLLWYIPEPVVGSTYTMEWESVI